MAESRNTHPHGQAMTDTMKTELKSCPFCGAPIQVGDSESLARGPGLLYVLCDCCGAMGGGGKTINDAIDAWNRRAALAPMKTEQRREAFEKWWNEYPSIDGIAYRAAWSAWCAALDSQAAQAQPSGWKLVPIEPTPEMIAAMAVEEATGTINGMSTIGMTGAAFAYEAMIAASPSHSKEPGDGGGVQPTNASVPVAVLREHWLHAMECDHEAERDKPHCACSLVDLGWHPSVGAAVEAWLAHVAGVADSQNGSRADVTRNGEA